MTHRSRFAAPITAAALAVLAVTACTTHGMDAGMGTPTGMGPSAPAAGRTGADTALFDAAVFIPVSSPLCG